MSDESIDLDAIVRSVRAHRNMLESATLPGDKKRSSRRHPAPIEQLLTDSGQELKSLFHKLAEHKSTFKAVQEHLPPWARSAFRSARLEGTQLILCFADGATANRFNYERIDFLNRLRKVSGYAGLTAITCKVTPSGN